MSNRYADYLKYLESDHWRHLKQDRRSISQGRCEACQSPRGFVGHHIVYREPLTACTRDDICMLCKDCHDGLHQWAKSVRMYDLSILGLLGTLNTCRECRDNGWPKKKDGQNLKPKELAPKTSQFTKAERKSKKKEFRKLSKSLQRLTHRHCVSEAEWTVFISDLNGFRNRWVLSHRPVEVKFENPF